jgi:hypothetical protein
MKRGRGRRNCSKLITMSTTAAISPKGYIWEGMVLPRLSSMVLYTSSLILTLFSHQLSRPSWPNSEKLVLYILARYYSGNRPS